MWCVDRPPFDAGETFAACISRVQDEGLKRRLTAIADNVKAEAATMQSVPKPPSSIS